MIPLASRISLIGVVSLLFGCAMTPARPNLPQAAVSLEGRSDIVGLVMDMDNTIGARVRKQDEYRILQLMNKDTGHWKSVYKWTQADRVWPLRTDRAKGSVLLVSNVGRNRSALVELSLTDGRERLLFADIDEEPQTEPANRGGYGLKLTHELKQPQ